MRLYDLYLGAMYQSRHVIGLTTIGVSQYFNLLYLKEEYPSSFFVINMGVWLERGILHFSWSARHYDQPFVTQKGCVTRHMAYLDLTDDRTSHLMSR